MMCQMLESCIKIKGNCFLVIIAGDSVSFNYYGVTLDAEVIQCKPEIKAKLGEGRLRLSLFLVVFP